MIDIMVGVTLGLLFFCCLTRPAGTIPAAHWWEANYDVTDNPAKKLRSGLSVYIDHGTGCHYLATSVFGGLTPRLDRDGKQVCEEGKTG